MKIKKILAMLAAVSIIVTATAGYFPATPLINYSVKVRADEAEEPTENESEGLTPELSEEELETVKSFEVSYAAEITENGLKYTGNSDGITITGYSGNEEVLVIPETIDGQYVISIGNNAFDGCTGLTEVKIPDSVKTIEQFSFRGCNKLSSVNLGSGLKTAGREVFSGCESLKSIVIPKSLTSSKGSYFGGESGMLTGSSIESLSFESGTEKVSDRLAQECTSLRTVYLPYTLSEIGASSFENCYNLEFVKSSRKTFKFTPSSFVNCYRLDDSRFTIMDAENTYLMANSSVADVNGIVNYTLKYKIMPSAAETAANIKIQLNIPEGMTLMHNTLQSSDPEFNADSINSNIVPVTSSEGELHFSARVTDYGDYNISASLNFRYNNSDWSQKIGSLDVICPDITLAVPETVNEASAEVYGIAARGRDVNIFVNGKQAGTFTANSYTGKYKGSVKLPSEDGTTEFEIYAQCDETVSDTVKTVYAVQKPVVKKVVFSYNQHSDTVIKDDITDVFLNGTSPVLIYNPGYATSFEITATNNERIDRMFVTSTKSGTDRYVEAFYNEETGTWISTGYFDENNHSYIPGTLNISILEKEEIILDDSCNYDENQYFGELPEEILENSNVDIVAEKGNSFIANVNVADGKSEDTFQMYNDADSDGLYINGQYCTSEEIAKNPQKYGFVPSSVYADENGFDVTYYTYIPDSRDIVSTMLLGYSDVLDSVNNAWTGAAVLSIIEGDYSNDPTVKLVNSFVLEEVQNVFDDYSSIGNAISFGRDFFKYEAEMMMAGDNEEYQAMASVIFAVKCFNTFGGTELLLGAVGCPPPLSTLLKVEIDMIAESLDSYLMDCIRENRQFTLSGYIKFIIDPSGIVYEAVIGNPVEGATVTIYYKDPETGETVKWNAEDYYQKNPLLTDKEGVYLWDVPEGEWKVVCEKEGYETAESDWMGIPPVRTEVNLGLVSKEAPEIVSAEKTGNEITVKFSKFVEVSTVTNETLKAEGEYTIEAKLLGEEDLYADTFVIKGASTEKVTVTEGVKSYAGTAAKAGTVTAEKTGLLAGDADGNGKVTIADAVVVLRYLAGGWNVEIDEKAADVNADGKVTVADAVILRRYIAGGWNVELKTAA